MLSFEPKHHQKVADGDCAGSWLPIFPPASAKTDLFLTERIRESERIQGEGGTIVVIDPMGDREYLSSHKLIMGSTRNGMSRLRVELFAKTVQLGIAGQELLEAPKNQKWYHRFDKRKIR